MGDRMKKKLTYLKDRLNDLSKRNRSIRMLKVHHKWSYDIVSLQELYDNNRVEKVLQGILKQQSSLTLMKTEINDEKSLAASHRLTTLYRNIKAIEEETGLYDLFVGYPFLSGVMLDGAYFRAPLFLFPVRLERVKEKGNKWVLENGESEPQLNRPLFLALKKLSSLHITEDMFDEAPEIAKNGDYNIWRDWLKGHSIEVELSGCNPKKFKDYRQDKVPLKSKGTIEVEPLAILGNFPQGNSALLKDYEELMVISDTYKLGIVEEMLGSDQEEFNDIDGCIQVDSDKVDNCTRPEKSKFFVLDTDGSQEEILQQADYQRGLVVHGPPGTGKSQVIVNLITNALSQGKRVLLVCQKRAALDVVYQRLDGLGLSKQVGLIHDEKHDRKNLYNKISSVLGGCNSNRISLEGQLEYISSEIEKCEEFLNKVAKGLFEVQEHGYRAYDLYGMAKPLDSNDKLLSLEGSISELNKNNLTDVITKILSFGTYFERFGKKEYLLKERKSFANLEIKDNLTIVETIKEVIDKAEQTVLYLNSFEQEFVTPEYSWLISDRIEKVYPDLTQDEKRTLQKIRLWWWTSFTGKTILEELLDGEKFKGLSSKEWPKLRERLQVLHDLAEVSQVMHNEIKSLSNIFSDSFVEKISKRISQGDIPLGDFVKIHESIISDFSDLRQMDRLYQESTPFIQRIIDMLSKSYNREFEVSLPQEWVEILKQSAFVFWIDEIERKYSDLAKIGTIEYQQIHERFKELINQKKAVAAKRIASILYDSVTQALAENTKRMRELKHQVEKRRQVWPVRKLVQNFALHGLLDVIPVWLTSPETISAIFPLEQELFDVVIFDEASQCTVENGIPSIYRGKQIIIAGDEKQLPPSRLFKGDIEEDEDEEPEFDIQESESLLNLAKRILPEQLLQWHYRSKSEELINFSNHAFYNGNIQIAPTVEPLKSPAAIQWHKINGKWINQSNEIEAIEVVKLLKKQLIKYPEQSIGIITFNAKQQSKVLDIIDIRIEDDPEFSAIYQPVMARGLDERVFVKNIENVQGDERDVIIFSIGYAPNEAGRIYNRFGTLNQQGGENRLNVAITRAKQQVHLVSSIEPIELDVANTKHPGPKLLKQYMRYAKAVSTLSRDEIEGILKEINEDYNTSKRESTLTFDSPFEEQVHKLLTELGYKVDTQVGMSGFRIDMAVVHPKEQHKYILGIECDGAMYHSSLSAKERDVYRQRFLESKGWKIVRIWSRNWWRNPSAEIERIDQEIRKILGEEHSRKNSQVS